MISIIDPFSFVDFNLIMHSYNENESAQTMTSVGLMFNRYVVMLRVADKEITIVIPATIPYSSDANTA